jgi:hypothetical protein
MKVSMVPREHVKNVWDEVRPYMEEAAKYTYGRYDADDILTAITDYDHDLWIAYDVNRAIKGSVVTCFTIYPKKKCLSMVFIGGTEALEWKTPMLEVLQHWAYDNDCDIIESSGRLGWARALRDDGYKMLWQTYELPIATSGLGD